MILKASIFKWSYLLAFTDRKIHKIRIMRHRYSDRLAIIFLLFTTSWIFRAAYRYITQANDSCLGRAKICLILTRGHERRKRVLASDDVAASNLNSREILRASGKSAGKIDKEYLHIDKMP